MHKKTQVLLTGGRGFIGSYTLELLCKRGFNARLFSGDIRRVRDWKRNLSEVEVVFHLAGVRTESEGDYFVNAKGPENLFLAMKVCGKVPKKIVYGSTQAVYMGNRLPFTERMKAKPTTIYGRSKLEGENISIKEGKRLGICVVVLRYSTVLGAGIREKSKMSGPLAHWVKMGLSGRAIEVFQDGRQTRDYVNVRDVAEANLLAVERLPSGIFNVGGGRSIAVSDLAKWVRRATGGLSEIKIMGGKATASDPKSMLSSIGKIECFGWRPRRSIRKAVKECVRQAGKKTNENLLS